MRLRIASKLWKDGLSAKVKHGRIRADYVDSHLVLRQLLHGFPHLDTLLIWHEADSTSGAEASPDGPGTNLEE